MTRGVDRGALLLLLGCFAFPRGTLIGIGYVVETFVIGDKQVAIEVSCPVAPLVSMLEYGDCRAVRLDYCYWLPTSWSCLCGQCAQ